MLSENRLLGQLGPQELAQLIGFSRIEKFDPNETIFQKGDSGICLYAILGGRVGINTISEDGKEIFLNILGPGAVFGEIALLDGKDRTAGAVAMEAARLLRVDRADFMPFLEKRPKLCIRLMSVLCERIRWTSDIIEDTVFLDIPRRLAKRLLVLGRGYGKPVEGGTKVDIRLSQEDLAHMLGATRESINKGLRLLERTGAIAVHGRHIIIKNERMLTNFKIR